MQELIVVAAPLKIRLLNDTLPDEEAETIAKDDPKHPYYIERLVWLSLFEAARVTLDHRIAICFG